MLRRHAVAAYLHGALLYGSVIACLHLLHNQVDSVRDGLVVLFWCQLLFGLWSLAAFAAGAALARGWSGIRKATPASDGRGLGLLVFGLMFWLPWFLHGLTYDNVPGGPPASAWGMLAYVMVVALAIALGVWAWTRALLRVPVSGRALARIAVAGYALAVAAALVLVAGAAPAAAPAPATTTPAAPTPAAPTPATTMPATLPAVSATGLDVILVALDGADWRVIEPLIAAGKLPAFAEILRRGSGGPLQSFPDSNSAVIWASIYSGERPERHGILDFYRMHLAGMRPGAGLFPVHRTFFKEFADVLGPLGLAERVAVSRYDLRALPIWEIADHLGLPAGVVDGYYYSFPAPRLATTGSFLLSYGLDGFYQQVIGGGGAARLKDLPLFLQPEPEALFRTIKPALTQPDFFWQAEALRALLGTLPAPRLLSFYTHEPDTVQHLNWKWYQPERFFGVRAEDVASRGGEIERLHREFDRFLGELLERVDERTVLMVVSDHGQSPTMLHQRFFTQHRHGPPGILLACGGPVRAGAAVADAGVLDVFPTVLTLLGLPTPADGGGGRVLSELLDEGFLREHPARAIPTYSGLWPPALPLGASSGLLDEELQRLKALGYI